MVENERRNGFYDINGNNLISVTTAESVLAKPALYKWMARMGARVALKDPTISEEDAIYNINKYKELSAERGKEVHSFCQWYEGGDDTSIHLVSNEALPYCRSFVSWYGDTQPKTIYSELVLVNETDGWAGSCDKLYKIGGSIIIVDFKTGKFIYDEAELQLSAYRHAEFGVYKGKKIVLPKIDKTAVLLLSPTGKPQYKEMRDKYEEFLCCVKLWIWQNEEQYLTRNVKIEKREVKK